MTPPAKQHASGMYVGKTLTLQQQVANLRMLGGGNLTRHMVIGSGLATLAGMAWFRSTESETQEVFAMFVTACCALVFLALAWGGPRFRQAAAGTHKGRRLPATIVLEPGMDDEEREGELHGILCPASPHLPRWRMSFARADGWKPPEGELHIEAVYLSDIDWPVLVLHPDGLLVPRGKPRRAK